MLRVKDDPIAYQYRKRASFIHSLTGSLHRLLRMDIPDGWTELEIQALYPERPDGPNGEMIVPKRFIVFRADLDRNRGHFMRGASGRVEDERR